MYRRESSGTEVAWLLNRLCLLELSFLPGINFQSLTTEREADRAVNRVGSRGRLPGFKSHCITS